MRNPASLQAKRQKSQISHSIKAINTDILKKIIHTFQKLSTNMHINELFKLTNRGY